MRKPIFASTLSGMLTWFFSTTKVGWMLVMWTRRLYAFSLRSERSPILFKYRVNSWSIFRIRLRKSNNPIGHWIYLMFNLNFFYIFGNFSEGWLNSSSPYTKCMLTCTLLTWVVTTQGIFILDLAAKIDATADFLCRTKWGENTYPPPFGRDAYPEEAYIAELDSKSGASLKFTILNRNGRIWTLVAGGGASVIYSDTICDRFFWIIYTCFQK